MRSICTLLVCVFLSAPLLAQRFKASGIQVVAGVVQDTYKDLSYSGMQQLTRNPENLPDLSTYQQVANDHDNIVSGGMLGLNLLLTPYNRKTGELRTNREIQVGLQINLEREAMLELVEKDPSSNRSTSDLMGYCLIENEVALAASYLFMSPTYFNNVLRFKGGPYINAGKTFGNNLYVLNLDEGEDLDTAPVSSARSTTYVRGGFYAGFLIDFASDFSVEFQGLCGLGNQVIHGQQNNPIRLFEGFQVGLNYTWH